jgi:hypothetical protein
MGTPLSGRWASVKLGNNLVANLGRWTVNFTLDEIDVSVFGTVWKKSMTGMQGWKGTLEGFYDPADTQQNSLQSDALAGTKITNIRFYVDSSSYWTPNTSSDSLAGCYISSVDVTHDKAGAATVTMNVLGFGELTFV